VAAASYPVRAATVRANGVRFGILEAGEGPLALCLHGFPDCAHTWGQLLPSLAQAGFHAVAPFMRGYSPTEVPADGDYRVAMLAADVRALHEELGGAGDAVLIGHDWGAETAYQAAAEAPERWRRLVTLAVPPAALDPVLLSDYEQLKRFFYLFLLQDSSGLAETVAARNNMAFLDQLWGDWSPGYQPGAHLAMVKQSLRNPENLTAAIGYYRANPISDEATTVPAWAPQPTLYLHGARDGCMNAGLAGGAERYLAPGSRMIVIEEAGHFLHLEQPALLNEHILSWIG
jgi:pimeloyl-ACP methyl ester carboxylesterase